MSVNPPVNVKKTKEKNEGKSGTVEMNSVHKGQKKENTECKRRMKQVIKESKNVNENFVRNLIM